jgi:hypothetical protein
LSTGGKKPDAKLQALIDKVTGKRPLTVINHILAHGKITTEELKDTYGYNHPPRAIRDVVEWGIPLKKTRVTGTDGRSIAAYEFDDLNAIQNHKLGGRRAFSKKFKQTLIAKYGLKCALCGEAYEHQYLQIDHRVPYEVAGNDGHIGDESSPDLFMLVCGTCNRLKSWSCEHCQNWLVEKESAVCQTCYWASPENYKHMALREIRRAEIVWSDGETDVFDKIKSAATAEGLSVQEYIKRKLSS